MDADARELARQWNREQLRDFQWNRLTRLFQSRAKNRTNLKAGKEPQSAPNSWEEFRTLPLVNKNDLPTGRADLPLAPEEYIYFHQTSGTQGSPVGIWDTAADWDWWIDCWQFVLDAASIDRGDRVMIASSFGPFIAWWSARDALAYRGVTIVPAGGIPTLGRIELLRRTSATALFATPTYALRIVEIAREQGIDLTELDVERIVVAGEPGGSIPAVRDRIESAFEATVYDHAGASEMGAWGFADAARQGLHVNEAEFIAEFLDPESSQPVAEGELAQLVLTPLGRRGMPVIRYQTGDLVRPQWEGRGPCRFVRLPGGVLGRTDDMIVVRGINIFPSSVEAIVRRFPEVDEFRLTVSRHEGTDALALEVEDRLQDVTRIEQELKLQLGLRVDVELVPQGSLPRFESKSKRFIDKRHESSHV